MDFICVKLFLSWIGNGILLASFGNQRHRGLSLFWYWAVVVIGSSLFSAASYLYLPEPMGFDLAVMGAMVLMAGAFFYENPNNLGQQGFLFLCCTCIAAGIAVISEAWIPKDTLVSGVVKIAICIILALVYWRFCAIPLHRLFQQLEGRWRWINSAGILFTSLCYYLILSYNSGFVTFHMALVMVLMTFFNYISLFCIVYYISKTVALSQAKLQEELLLNQVGRLMDAEEQARIMRHDLRHHNQTIAVFARKGQTTELLEYLSDYDHSLLGDIHPVYCCHTMANNILNVYHNRTQALGITFTVQAALQPDCPVDTRDFMGILSNLLENAVHGCSGEMPLEITVKLFEKGGKLVILCENTIASPVLFHNGIPQSRTRKGTGMTSILRTVNRYDGLADFRQQHGKFTAHVILNLR